MDDGSNNINWPGAVAFTAFCGLVGFCVWVFFAPVPVC